MIKKLVSLFSKRITLLWLVSIGCPSRAWASGGTSMQAEIDKIRLLVHTVSGGGQCANVEVIEPVPAVLPLCTIRAALEAHPVIKMNSLDATKVYNAMLKLIQLRSCKISSNNSESTSCAYGLSLIHI